MGTTTPWLSGKAHLWCQPDTSVRVLDSQWCRQGAGHGTLPAPAQTKNKTEIGENW